MKSKEIHNMRKLSSSLLTLLLIGLLALPSTLRAKDGDKFVLVIDPGHGAGDVGTPHRKQKLDEKDIALRVALRLGRHVETNFKDVKVVYTRDDDEYPSLPRRAQIAKEAKGDLYISIHVNSAPDKTARGFETYIFGISGQQNKSAAEQKRLKERMQAELETIADRENRDITGRLIDFEKDIDMETKILCQTEREKHNRYSEDVAEDVQNSLIAGIRRTSYKEKVKDRGVKRSNLFVLCYVPMPAILIELGYMSNPEEEKFLNTQEGMECFAKSIYSGFVKYKRTWDKRQLPAQKPTVGGGLTAAVTSARDRQQPAAEPPAPAAPAAKPTPEPKKAEAKPAAPAQPATPAQPAAPAASTTPAAPATSTAPSQSAGGKSSGFMPLAPAYKDQTPTTHPAPKPEPKTEPAPAPKPEPKAEPAPTPKPEPRAEPAPAPKPELKAEPAPAPNPEPKAEPKPEPKAEPAPAPKPEPKAEPKAEPTPAPKPAAADDVIFYRVQFLSHTKLLPDGAPEFKGLEKVWHYQDGNVYRYTYGEATSAAALAPELKKVRALFGDAFPAKFDSQGNRIR